MNYEPPLGYTSLIRQFVTVYIQDNLGQDVLLYVSLLLCIIGDYVWIGVDAIFPGQHVSVPLFAFRTNHDSM